MEEIREITLLGAVEEQLRSLPPTHLLLLLNSDSGVTEFTLSGYLRPFLLLRRRNETINNRVNIRDLSIHSAQAVRVEAALVQEAELP